MPPFTWIVIVGTLLAGGAALCLRVWISVRGIEHLRTSLESLPETEAELVRRRWALRLAFLHAAAWAFFVLTLIVALSTIGPWLRPTWDHARLPLLLWIFSPAVVLALSWPWFMFEARAAQDVGSAQQAHPADGA